MPRSSTVSTTASLAGRDPELVHQPAHARAEHHAGQVVAAEHQRLLDHAGREHDLAGPEAVHGVALVDGHEVALVDAARPGRLEDLDAGRARRRLELGRPGRPRRCPRTRAGRRAPGPRPRAPCRGPRGRAAIGGLEARLAAADHEHVDVPVHLLVAAVAAVLGVELAEAGRRAQELLVVLPRPARAHERLVVEADLHAEGRRGLGRARAAASRSSDGQALMCSTCMPVGDRRRARPHRRVAVDLDEAVGALAGAAQEAARAVVLERAREHPHAARRRAPRRSCRRRGPRPARPATRT